MGQRQGQQSYWTTASLSWKAGGALRHATQQEGLRPPLQHGRRAPSAPPPRGPLHTGDPSRRREREAEGLGKA